VGVRSGGPTAAHAHRGLFRESRVAGSAAARTAAALTGEEPDVLRDNLGDVALVAVLVVVAAGADLALDEDLATLAQKLAAGLALFPPDDDVVPLGALLARAVGVVPGGRSGEGEFADRLTAAGEAHLGVFAEVADENGLVDRHDDLRGDDRIVARRLTAGVPTVNDAE
jgi:hypothetical protein